MHLHYSKSAAAHFRIGHSRFCKLSECMRILSLQADHSDSLRAPRTSVSDWSQKSRYTRGIAFAEYRSLIPCDVIIPLLFQVPGVCSKRRTM